MDCYRYKLIYYYLINVSISCCYILLLIYEFCIYDYEYIKSSTGYEKIWMGSPELQTSLEYSLFAI